MKNHTWLGITNERQENVYFLDYELRPLGDNDDFYLAGYFRLQESWRRLYQPGTGRIQRR